MYEMPPILKGTEKEQIAALRDYLARIMRTRNTEEQIALTAAPQQQLVIKGGSDEKEVRENISNLKNLIIKNANYVERTFDEYRQELHEDYLALSDFGEFTESLVTTITQTARGVVEEYDYDALIQVLTRRDAEMDAYLTSIRGEIRRGLIEDPVTHEVAMGIAISEHLQFTGQVHMADGLSYYELSPGQTLGLYTATGWQFWINGSKRGWFSSEDSMLHLSSLVAENRMLLGSDWQITHTGGFGIKYIGG